MITAKLDETLKLPFSTDRSAAIPANAGGGTCRYKKETLRKRAVSLHKIIFLNCRWL
jgi:hypothetical protein